MTTAIFLGAGASKAEGAPLQTELFRDYFKLIRERREQRVWGTTFSDMELELRTFFLLMFDIDVDNDDLDAVDFPTFEEALGILDLAELRNETFREYSLDNMASNSNRIRFVRQYLIMSMVEVIHDRLLRSKDLHRRLVQNLMGLGILEDTIFITTNYDIIADNALSMEHGSRIDYGCALEANVRLTRGENDRAGVRLYKLHGSLNWLYCSTCNTLILTAGEKGAIRLIRNFREAGCQTCGTVLQPLVVPPTFYKDMSNVFLREVWHRAERDLSQVQHVIFCGYSFPEADMHIKYLLKRVQKNRDPGLPLRISVLNHHKNHYEAKSEEHANEEENRYKRFFGRNVVKFSREEGFEDFVDNPSKYL